MNVLEIKNLSYTHNGNNTLNNINLQFEANKSYCILGKNNIDKITFLAFIGGFTKAPKNKIFFQNQDISTFNLNTYRSTKIAIIFKNFQLINNYSILDNILTIMNISKQKVNIQNIYELFEKVNLSKDLIKLKPLDLTVKECLKVSIIIALAKNTEVIIADEITQNLTDTEAYSICKLLTHICKEQQKTLIILTHSNLIATTTNHVYGITNGYINYIK